MEEIEMGVYNVVSILAVASFLNLQSIIDECAEVMKETINSSNLEAYYSAAESYGVPSVKKAISEWRRTNHQ